MTPLLSLCRTWCGNLDATLPVIDSFEIQKEMNSLALAENTMLWTGMRNENSVYFTQDNYSPEPIELNITSFYWQRLYRNSRYVHTGSMESGWGHQVRFRIEVWVDVAMVR